ncbi:Uncharacterised protein [Achromobacter sp. 2789STDY5608615]|nr:Uncharacterised protein [Achromobacter sp. 2789STDY5608615]
MLELLSTVSEPSVRPPGLAELTARLPPLRIDTLPLAVPLPVSVEPAPLTLTLALASEPVRLTVPPLMLKSPLLVLAPPSVRVPAPVLVMLPAPASTPPKRLSLALPSETLASACSTPLPVRLAMDSAPVSCSVAPLSMRTPEAELMALPPAATSVPCATPMPPDSVLPPLSVRLPVPVFSRLPAPDSTLPKAPLAFWLKVRVVLAAVATLPRMLPVSPVRPPALSWVLPV